MIPVLCAAVAGVGVFLLHTAIGLGWQGLRPTPPRSTPRSDRRLSGWLRQAGLDDVRPIEFVIVLVAASVAGATAGHILFGGPVPAIVMGTAAAGAPVVSHRRRRATRRREAHHAWPRLVEEIRLETGSLGRSIPDALFAVGARGPEAMRPAFAAARREWMLTTDLDRASDVLKSALDDPSADMVCETLLVAHELGGADLDRRLDELAADRRADVDGRDDAESRQAGARFARRFVVVVPVAMALVGSSIGDGRDAYRSSAGQTAVVVAVAMVAGCWWWADRIMRIPETERVFP